MSATASDGGSEVSKLGAGFAADVVPLRCAEASAGRLRLRPILSIRARVNDLRNLFFTRERPFLCGQLEPVLIRRNGRLTIYEPLLRPRSRVFGCSLHIPRLASNRALPYGRASCLVQQLNTFNEQRESHAPAYAKSRQAKSGAALFHFMQKSCSDANAGATDRMT